MGLGEHLGNASEKGGNVVAKAFSGITGIYKDAIAANKADDINEANMIASDASQGVLHNTGIIHDIGDGVEDALNVATMGLSRRVTNVFTHEIDYKALKAEKKAAKSEGVVLSVKDRTAALSDYVDSDKYSELKTEQELAERAKYSSRETIDVEENVDSESDVEYEE